MIKFSIKDLKESRKFIDCIRWEITPKILLKPRVAGSVNRKEEKKVSAVENMFYVDTVFNRPALVIMRNRGGMSKTVGYVGDAPEDLLKEALNCDPEECIAGMYPITKKLEEWLKRELGLS